MEVCDVTLQPEAADITGSTVRLRRLTRRAVSPGGCRGSWNRRALLPMPAGAHNHGSGLL